MAAIDEAALFKEMEASLRYEKAALADDTSSTASTCDLDSDMENDEEFSQGTVYYLDDGDVHVCKGFKCPMLELNAESEYICGCTGVVFGRKTEEEPAESVTGRKPTNSQDDHAGEPVGGRHYPKRDMFQASCQAYLAASADTDDVMEKSTYVDQKSAEKAAAPRLSSKRGALCVDQKPPPLQPTAGNKRARVNKREFHDQDTYNALVTEAEGILNKLVNYDKKTSAKPREAPSDPRLMDPSFLFGAAVKKYVKECLAASVAPSLDAIHNIGIMAHNVALEEQKKAQAASASQPKLLRLHIRTLCSKLVVALWTASCKTSYMDSAKRGGDSFAPFAAGVYYALKRGVALADGRIVVPALNESYTNALPALRATAHNSAAKRLHSSSHRGLCTLHRCVNSFGTTSGYLFDDAAKCASQLAAAAV